jgi:hypothetical protein
MKKVKANRRHAAKAEKPVPCPVLPIAVRVGELWDAHAMAQEREHAYGKEPDASEKIDELRLVVEETASFERARSMAGALFQVALAEDAARALFEKVPAGNKDNVRMFERLDRLLDSVALVLRDACTAEEYRVVKNVVNLYVPLHGEESDPPFKWLEEIPELPKAYRSIEAA